jgi:hypothetical protein
MQYPNVDYSHWNLPGKRTSKNRIECVKSKLVLGNRVSKMTVPAPTAVKNNFVSV